MKRSKAFMVIIITIALVSCSGNGKKVLIMASGKLTVTEDPKNIKLEPGTTHSEKEIELTGSDKTTLTVQSPDGNKTYDINESGYYLLNLKPDTLVGGVIKYGTSGMPASLSNEQVDHIIDSTQKLMLGQNASDANKSYFVAPFTVKKISASVSSKIIGPYNGIPNSVGVDDSGKSPETYKFYTNKQKRETLEDIAKRRKQAQQ